MRKQGAPQAGFCEIWLGFPGKYVWNVVCRLEQRTTSDRMHFHLVLCRNDVVAPQQPSDPGVTTLTTEYRIPTTHSTFELSPEIGPDHLLKLKICVQKASKE